MGVEPECDWAIIGQADLHVSPELSRLNNVQSVAACGDESVEVVRSLIRRRALGETRTRALLCIRRQRELGYEQQLAPDIANTTIHAACLIREDAVSEQALGQPGNVFRCVIAVYGHKHHKAPPYFSDRVPSYTDFSLGYAL